MQNSSNFAFIKYMIYINMVTSIQPIYIKIEGFIYVHNPEIHDPILESMSLSCSIASLDYEKVPGGLKRSVDRFVTRIKIPMIFYVECFSG